MAKAKTNTAPKGLSEDQKKAFKVATDNGVKIVFKNSKGEYFTSKNLALLSDEPKNIETYDFTKFETTAGDTGDGKEARKLTAIDFTNFPALKEKGYQEGDVLKPEDAESLGIDVGE